MESVSFDSEEYPGNSSGDYWINLCEAEANALQVWGKDRYGRRNRGDGNRGKVVIKSKENRGRLGERNGGVKETWVSGILINVREFRFGSKGSLKVRDCSTKRVCKGKEKEDEQVP